MKETILLDTNVASFLFKSSKLANPFRKVLRGKRLSISFASVAELFKWAIKRRWQREQIERLEDHLARYVVVTYDKDLAWCWARVIASSEDARRPIAPTDACIAATTLRRDLSLVTNNVRHFEAAEELCGLKLIRRG